MNKIQIEAMRLVSVVVFTGV